MLLITINSTYYNLTQNNKLTDKPMCDKKPAKSINEKGRNIQL